MIRSVVPLFADDASRYEAIHAFVGQDGNLDELMLAFVDALFSRHFAKVGMAPVWEYPPEIKRDVKRWDEELLGALADTGVAARFKGFARGFVLPKMVQQGLYTSACYLIERVPADVFEHDSVNAGMIAVAEAASRRSIVEAVERRAAEYKSATASALAAANIATTVGGLGV